MRSASGDTSTSLSVGIFSPSSVSNSVLGETAVVLEASPRKVVAVLQNGETLTITGRVEDPENRLAKLTLHYRSGTKTFVALPVTLADGTFRTQVPGAAVKAPLIDYYLEGQGKDGLRFKEEDLDDRFGRGVAAVDVDGGVGQAMAGLARPEVG